MTESVLAGIAFLLGACVGSFLNVVIYRLPAGLSIAWPPSHCPKCQQRLKPYDNIPIMSWLWLKRRCRYCRARISPRYPLIEALTGSLFLLVFWQFSWSWQAVGMGLLISWLLALAMIDIDTLTLPDALTKSGLILGILFHSLPIMGTVWEPAAGVQRLFPAIVGMVVGLWVFDLISLVGLLLTGKVVMGGGDGKLAALLGAWLGWQGVLLSSFLACAIGASIGGIAIAIGVLRRGTPIPFGPYLAAGGIITLLWGDALIQWYLRVFFPLSR